MPETKPKTFALSRLPERFQQGPHSAALAKYIEVKYGAYGFRRSKSIEYNPEFKPEYTQGRYRWVENIGRGLRKTGDAHELVKLNHTGWYTNEFQDEIVHGEVWQLPARNQPQYVPAVNDPCNRDCSCVDFTSVTSDKEDCARWADRMAELWAESEREYQEKESAKQRLQEIEDEIREKYQDFRRIAREIRANCEAVKGIAIVRELVGDRWRETKQDIRRLRREQREIESA